MKIMCRVLSNVGIDYQLANWLIWAPAHFDVEVVHTDSNGVTEWRNIVTGKDFLPSDADVLWFVDSDTIPPQTLKWLPLVQDCDVFGLPYRGYTPRDVYWHVFKYMGVKKGKRHYGSIQRKDWPTSPTMEVDALGTGCTLIHRRVFEAMPKYPFNLIRNDDWTVGTEDMNFCYEARKKGFKVWASTKYTCGHVKDINLKDF